MHEPNDTETAPTVFSDIEGTTIEIADAYLSPSSEEDRYEFWVEDGFWDWFNINAELTDVPAGVNLKLELWHVRDADGEATGELADESDEEGAGGGEEVSVGEGWWPFGDASGYYQVVVSSTDGSTCDSPYTLTIAADTR